MTTTFTTGKSKANAGAIRVDQYGDGVAQLSINLEAKSDENAVQNGAYYRRANGTLRSADGRHVVKVQVLEATELRDFFENFANKRLRDAKSVATAAARMSETTDAAKRAAIAKREYEARFDLKSRFGKAEADTLIEQVGRNEKLVKAALKLIARESLSDYREGKVSEAGIFMTAVGLIEAGRLVWSGDKMDDKRVVTGAPEIVKATEPMTAAEAMKPRIIKANTAQPAATPAV